MWWPNSGNQGWWSVHTSQTCLIRQWWSKDLTCQKEAEEIIHYSDWWLVIPTWACMGSIWLCGYGPSLRVASTRPFFVTLRWWIKYVLEHDLKLTKLYECLLDGVLRMVTYVRDQKCSQRFHAQLQSAMWRNVMAWSLDNWPTCDLWVMTKSVLVCPLSSDRHWITLYWSKLCISFLATFSVSYISHHSQYSIQ